MSSVKEHAEVPSADGRLDRITTAVIRRTEMNHDDPDARFLIRHLPAWVISGAIHVLAICVGVLLVSSPQPSLIQNVDLALATHVEEPKEAKENLTNEEIGFDADLALASEIDKEEPFEVNAPKSDEPIGLDLQSNENIFQASLAGSFEGAGEAVNDAPNESGTQTVGNGGGATLTVPGMQGRNSGATRDLLIQTGGGNLESEAAVARGLAWLSRVQLADGSWEFDGDKESKDYKIAATAVALLPFLSAGETHKSGGKYSKIVGKGLDWLVEKVDSEGQLSNNMYEQAIGAVCLCEAVGMTRDPIIKFKATQVIRYIVKAQAKNGSWGYKAGAEGDTSIVGWQIQALHSAKLAEIRFDKEKVYQAAEKFLNQVASDSGAKYGYRTPLPTKELTSVGLLCRYYMGWTPKNPAFQRGVEFIKKSPPTATPFDIYYYYYATQVMHVSDGPNWHDFWNPKIRELLISLQNKSSDAKVKGSWEKDGSYIGFACGRLGTTCLALLTLEVYYRHLPLYKRDSGGLAELER